MLYNPPTTVVCTIMDAQILDPGIVQVYAGIKGEVGWSNVNLDGPNRGSTYGMRIHRVGFGNLAINSVTAKEDGGLDIHCPGVAAGDRFISISGNQSLDTAEGFKCAGCVKKII